MIDAILRWSLSHRLPVLVAAGVLLVWGGYTASRMPVDVFPDLTAPTVTVITEAHGMAPEELETRVTSRSSPRSTARRGSAACAPRPASASRSSTRSSSGARTSSGRAKSSPRSCSSCAMRSPPRSSAGPRAHLVDHGRGPVPRRDDGRCTADGRAHVRRLHAAPKAAGGAWRVAGDRDGRGARQFEVALDPERWWPTTSPSPRWCARSRRRTPASPPASSTRAGRSTSCTASAACEPRGRGRDARRISAATRPSSCATSVRSARRGPARGEGSYDGRPAVIVGIQKQPGTNTLELTERIDRELDELERTLPAGLRLERDVFRQADFIEVAVENVLAALRDGVALVLLIVLLFLASGRASAITIVAIPLSLVTAVFALSAFGATLNTMTLGGMAIAVGELVDDAVIDVENVVRRLRERAARRGRARRPCRWCSSASREIRSSIVFATSWSCWCSCRCSSSRASRAACSRRSGIAYVVSLDGLALRRRDGDAGALLVPAARLEGRDRGARAAPRAWLKRATRRCSSGAMRRLAARGGVSFALLASRVSRSCSRGARSSPSSARGR
jgi:hypothetical protein